MWQPFTFHGLLACGHCDSPKKWAVIKASYARHWPQRDLLLAKREPGKTGFGITAQHTGETLGEWATENKVEL